MKMNCFWGTQVLEKKYLIPISPKPLGYFVGGGNGEYSSKKRGLNR